MPQRLYLSRTANHGMNIGVEGLLMSSFIMRLAKTVCPFWSGKPWYSDLDFQSCWGFIFCTLPFIPSRVIIYFMGAQNFAPYHTYAYSYYGRVPFRYLVPEPRQGLRPFGASDIVPPLIWIMWNLLELFLDMGTTSCPPLSNVGYKLWYKRVSN